MNNSIYDIADLSITTANLITWGVGLVFIIAIILTSMPTIKYLLHERRLKVMIRRLGASYIKNVIVPDGIGGSSFIDYLILQPEKILIVMLKRYRGTIFCGDNIDQWTQLVGKRSFKFPNPIRLCDLDVQSISNIVAPVSVSGMVVFHGDCDFPKGKPEQVKLVSELFKQEKEQAKPNALVSQAWTRLQQVIQEHKPEHDYAKSYFRNQYEPIKLLVPSLLTFMLLGWLYLRVFLLV